MFDRRHKIEEVGKCLSDAFCLRSNILHFLLIALTFATLFAFVGLTLPSSFKGITFAEEPTLVNSITYLSFVTLTSTGYGDIVPVHPLARSLCNLEAVIGQLFPATLLARLVTLQDQELRT